MFKNAAISLALLTLSAHCYSQARIGTGNVKTLYDQYCAACHGNKLQGGAAVSLVDDDWIHNNDDATLARIISNGVAGTEMGGYSDVLDDEQVRSLVVLIREYGAITRSESRTSKHADDTGVYSSDLHSFKLEHIVSIDGILWGMDFLPDGTALVTQKDGKLWHIRDNKADEVKGIPEVWDHGQGGLLDVQIHPDYAQNAWVYLSYAENNGAREGMRSAGMTAIARGKIIDGKWQQGSVIYRFPDELHNSAGAHFGSRIVFKDGLLYFSIGDRGRMQEAQDLSRPNGKIHRITPEGKIPKDNPFVNTEGALPSIWSYGNRNPQGLAFHPVTGDLWETEHGPRGGDELNVIESGHNYGWPKVTFGINYNGKPISGMTHAEGISPPATYWTPSIAIAGMDFYTGQAFPKWQNHLFLGGMRAEELYRIKTDGKNVAEQELILKDAGRVRDVINGPDGYLYLLLNDRGTNSGKVVRLVSDK